MSSFSANGRDASARIELFSITFLSPCDVFVGAVSRSELRTLLSCRCTCHLSALVLRAQWSLAASARRGAEGRTLCGGAGGATDERAISLPNDSTRLCSFPIYEKMNLLLQSGKAIGLDIPPAFDSFWLQVALGHRRRPFAAGFGGGVTIAGSREGAAASSGTTSSATVVPSAGKLPASNDPAPGGGS